MHLYSSPLGADILIIKAWLRRKWHVYRVGHPEDHHAWLASFASEDDAIAWVGHAHTIGGSPHSAISDDPTTFVGNLTVD